MTSPDPGPMLMAMLLGAAALAACLLARGRTRSRQRYVPLPRGFRGSRLQRMLGLRRLAVADYLRATSDASVKLHLRLCDGCESQRRCDSATGTDRAGQYDFCPNSAPLDRIQRDRRKPKPGGAPAETALEILANPGDIHRSTMR